jgi:hypothetical protein
MIVIDSTDIVIFIHIIIHPVFIYDVALVIM